MQTGAEETRRFCWWLIFQWEIKTHHFVRSVWRYWKEWNRKMIIIFTCCFTASAVDTRLVNPQIHCRPLLPCHCSTWPLMRWRSLHDGWLMEVWVVSSRVKEQMLDRLRKITWLFTHIGRWFSWQLQSWCLIKMKEI